MEPKITPVTNINYYCNFINIIAKFGCSSAPLYKQIKCLENVDKIYSECISPKKIPDKN